MTIASTQTGWRPLVLGSSRADLGRHIHGLELPITRVTRQEVNHDCGGCAVPVLPAGPGERKARVTARRSCNHRAMNGQAKLLPSDLGCSHPDPVTHQRGDDLLNLKQCLETTVACNAPAPCIHALQL